ncbi:hypothetical protein B0E47_07145 [Rhodanobacter sp. B05]|uniref:DUF2884 family protein n=1 Tax=Rhodanobacter sp. B05 TaxID=1945859 RepID=UPI0009868B6B|nr:DUF2884 family protein [Rhodanobacter sp. B05]OOG57093.1 hypothetical protein B0E47_07145 [Rhodanobacter sp. B05]
MRSWLALVTLLSLLVAAPLRADDLATVCHATSSYDVTLRADSLLFDRPSPAPTRVELQHGSLRIDGIAVTLDPEQQDRLTLFERDLRALAPRVRKVAQNGVDMAVQALRAEVANLGLGADTRAEFDRRLNAHAAELKQRIDNSQSTHDWQGDAMQQYTNQVAGDLMPLLAADLGQQAVNAALAGDLQGAADLRDRASSLATELQPRLQQRLQALRPQIEALCPAIQRLGRLQQGLRDSRGQPLDLLQISR